jgi:6-pyruvoyltetrahydropterin/6-carboxytetrahydropterin synthase
MMQTFKEFSFEAAHKIPPYSDVHGHSFRVSVVIGGEPDATYGWSVSLYDLEDRLESLRRELDHKYLNDIEGLDCPSLENLARWIWDRLAPEIPGLERVSVARGVTGQSEGCTYAGPGRRVHADA